MTVTFSNLLILPLLTAISLINAFPADVMMLEGDVLMGYLVPVEPWADPELVRPIMAHPPNNSSDLSVQLFLKQVSDFNKANPDKVKGIKLDFKEIEAVLDSIRWLKSISSVEPWVSEVWLNADIVQGPLHSTKEPVDPMQFLDFCREYPNGTLSIGWTTNWGSNYSVGEYTQVRRTANWGLISISNTFKYSKGLKEM